MAVKEDLHFASTCSRWWLNSVEIVVVEVDGLGNLIPLQGAKYPRESSNDRTAELQT